jgi:hypothetical protein
MLKKKDALPSSEDCTVCTQIQSRHESAMTQLNNELGESTRFVCMKVLMVLPGVSAFEWDSYDHGKLYVENCYRFPIAHAAALLIDTSCKMAWLCEVQSQKEMLDKLLFKVQELATVLGLKADVHPLCKQWQSSQEGNLSKEFCLLYSQATALALSRVTSDSYDDTYLADVFRLMYNYIRNVMPTIPFKTANSV